MISGQMLVLATTEGETHWAVYLHGGVLRVREADKYLGMTLGAEGLRGYHIVKICEGAGP